MYKLFIELIFAGVGGALGAVLRLLLSRAVQMVRHWQFFPMGILLVNVLGCFAIGVVAGILIARPVVSINWRAFIIIGLLGGFTTFSSFTLDTVSLWQQGMYTLAAANILASVVLCLLATSLGFILVNIFN